MAAPPQPEGVRTQDPPSGQETMARFEGRVVRSIVVERRSLAGTREPLGPDAADRILRTLPIVVGQPFRRQELRVAGETLWREWQIVPAFEAKAVEDGMILYVVIKHRDQPFDRTEFRGLDHFSEAQVNSILGISPDRRVTGMQAESLRNTLRDRYRREGYPFCEIEIRRDEEASILTFMVDEGPLVTIRNVHFRGNISIPGVVPLGLGSRDALVRDADLKSSPAWAFISGGPYSREVIEEDLDRLQLLYRRKGFLDAEVLLAAPVFTESGTEVDLTFRVIERERYRITQVDLEQEFPADRDEPFYPVEEVMEEVRVKAGDFYDWATIRADSRVLQRFYGRRGHPVSGSFGQQIPAAFAVLEHAEIVDPTEPEIRLVYRVREGTVKTLRDVIIRGNTFTRDSVIRRKIFLLPGDRVNMEQVARSQRFLNELRYFQNPTSLAGPQLQLVPVPGQEDQLDLAVDVTEGETGRFVWGIGITTGAGVQARIELTKRNFDLFNLPSSANPITAIGEILANRAFHGGGQSLELILAPGTQVSQFSVSFFEPDLFGEHVDTIGLRVGLARRLRRFDSYDQDTFGATLGLERFFSEEFAVGLAFEPEEVTIDNLDANAPAIVYDAEGSTDLRRLRINANLRVLDRLLRPTEGYTLRAGAKLGGAFLGGDEDFYSFSVNFDWYLPIFIDLAERAHVLHLSQGFNYGAGFGRSNDLFLSERWYMGGVNLRGFEPRRAGPMQFGNPTGGEARYTASLEYEFPLMSTRLPGTFVDMEILRGVVFTDFGLLGLEIDDPTFREPRLSVGFGVRIDLPVLGIPIALDLGWPLFYEETDGRQVVFFSLRR